MPERIVIVGAGFCGTVLAANLLEQPPRGAAEIVLVERGKSMGRGLAYARGDCPYVLNVPAGRLSADSRDPEHFLRFARGSIPKADAEDFLPRALYGDYLEDLLSRAEQSRAPQVRLQRIFGEAVDIVRQRDDKPLSVRLADGASFAADRVVLAPGNPLPRLPSWAAPLRSHAALLPDPWSIPAHFGAEHSLLIVGNGLTMADTVLAVSRDPAKTPRLLTVSRRGLIPLPQATFRPTAIRGDGAALIRLATSIRELLRASRSLAHEVALLGGDWREVITYLRNLAPVLWDRLPVPERRRFLRHVQCYWDVHRHRLPPMLADHLEELRRSGRLDIQAGRIAAVEPVGERLDVSWVGRGGGARRSTIVDALVIATGPDYSVERSQDPLLAELRRAGTVSADELHLGLRTRASGECVAADGSTDGRLYYLGPMLRATFWEATAATELRDHAEALARHLAMLSTG